MTTDPNAHPIVRPVDILSGLGTLNRTEICQMIALIECVDGLFLAKGAVAGIGTKLGMNQDFAANQLQAAQDGLVKSSATDGDLRFRCSVRVAQRSKVEQHRNAPPCFAGVDDCAAHKCVSQPMGSIGRIGDDVLGQRLG
jgi:hypothetical protein